MDIPRPSRKKEKLRKRILLGIAAAIAIGLITVGLNSLEPAAREVDRASVLLGQVKRGEMLRSVRGPGTLVPKEIRFLAAEQDGVVERRRLEAGATVTANQVIVDLSNPEVEQSLEEAELQVLAAKADYSDLKLRLESGRLDQEANLSRVKADDEGARLDADANQELFEADVISEIVLKRSLLTVEQTKVRYEIEKQRLTKLAEANTAQLEAKQSEVDQREAVVRLRRGRVDSLKVRAGIDGVLQEVLVEIGQRVSSGETLARVAQPRNLKAELRINETQAKDILVGQIASIDTRNGVIEGHVVRIDPSVQQGSVTVDVALDGELPRGARPDLSVNGVIELERLTDVLYVNRPTYVQPNSRVGLFRVEPDGALAVRIPVELGRISVQTIEIIAGLDVDDEVILSDTSAYDDVDRIRIR